MIEENNSLNCGKDPCLVCGKLTSGLHFEVCMLFVSAMLVSDGASAVTREYFARQMRNVRAG